SKERSQIGSKAVRNELIVATIYYFDAPVGADFVKFFEQTLKPALVNTGVSILAYFVTEHSENTYPALPVREDENVFVWFARFDNQAAYELHVAPLARSPRWQDEISEELARPLKRPPEVLKLSPSVRSLL